MEQAGRPQRSSRDTDHQRGHARSREVIDFHDQRRADSDRVPAQDRGTRRSAGRRTFGSISRLPSGNWRARYADPSHQGPGRPAWINAPTTFLTKRDAAGWLAAREAEIVEHRWRPAPPPPAEPVDTFARYSAGWLASRELKPSTMREYTRMMKVLVGAFGTQRLDEMTSADVRQWYAGLNPELKTARAHHYALLRSVLGSAVTRNSSP